jgi:hypothetical protein
MTQTQHAIQDALALIGRARAILMHAEEDIAEIGDCCDTLEDIECELRAVRGPILYRPRR